MSNEKDNNPAPEEERIETAVPPASESEVSPGRVLAQRREELNLTVAQVAGHLNLAPRQVEAIEADNFSALPGIAIARGFVRSYAKLVQVDAEPLLAAMAPAVAPMPDARPINQSYVSKPLTGDRLSFGSRSAKSSKSVWIVLGVVAAGVAVAAALQFGAGFMSSDPDDGAASADPAVQTQEAPEQDGRTFEVLPAPDVPAESTPDPATAPAAAPNSEPASSPAPAPAPASQSAQPPVPVGSDVSSNTSSIDEKNALILNMREQSWVEVKRADGAIIAARVFDAGAVEAFPVKGEMSVVVGNASGVDASLRGDPLDLRAKARANVARVNVK